MHELLKRQNKRFFAISQKEKPIDDGQETMMAHFGTMEDDKRQKIILVSYLHALRYFTIICRKPPGPYVAKCCGSSAQAFASSDVNDSLP